MSCVEQLGCQWSESERALKSDKAVLGVASPSLILCFFFLGGGSSIYICVCVCVGVCVCVFSHGGL